MHDNVILIQANIVSSPLILGGVGISFLKIGQRVGSKKNYSEIGGWLKQGEDSPRKGWGGGGFQIVSSVFLKKSMFSLLLEFFPGKYSRLL